MPELTDILLYIAIGLGALCLLLLLILIARPAKGGDGTALKRIEDKTEEALKYADYSARAADNLSRNTEMRLNNIESRLAEDIKYIADVNAHNLEVIRRTVDDKLTSSDGKLSESYARISDRLEKMHKSVGEMQALSESVSDIRRVFTNVKLRGTWGETQLNALLEQMLAPDQYERSCKLDPLGNTLVDFAIRLPSVSGDTLLPVDSKFPVEEYERLCESSEKGDWAGTELAKKNLERAVRVQAESIAKKYILPPVTTDFAVLYLPSEALYAEVLKMAGLADFLHKRRIILSGPSNFAALLSLLQTGFRTAAIEKRSGELVRTLEQFRMEFARFAEGLDRAKRKLQEAQDSVENAAKRTDVIGRQLDRFQIADNPPNGIPGGSEGGEA
ncbi:MAG: DNA recombination protein RmuC [Bacillota bacterium]|uniref:DNA recombination protein RmuC n=1 Tax=Candidatus Gallimonas intestinavium TaxID=2838603 RepID=A0A9D2G5G4_9FIRM|nr:MAG: DNA recombination protein RmuC [Bacillota bacterium]HIZ72567.1 DNA recombination protein RmuC [Candidatus Gallimonas intestinavium]